MQIRSLALFALLLVLALPARHGAMAAEPSTETPAGVIESYRRAWLANAERAVLGLFSEDAIVVPHGRAPLVGKEAIRAFWFPPADGSRVTIDRFEFEVGESETDDVLAYALGNSRLRWTYERAGRATTTEQEGTAVFVFRRQDGVWKIVRQIWTDRNVRRIEKTAG